MFFELNPHKEISTAEKLVQEGENEQAKQILELLLAKEKWTNALCGDVIAIYDYGGMYAEALKVHSDYEKRFGKACNSLTTDRCSVEALKESLHKQNKEAVTSNSVLEFNKMSYTERGGRTSGGTFFWLSRIKLYPDYLVVTRFSRDYTFAYSEVISAYVKVVPTYIRPRGFKRDEVCQYFVIRTASNNFIFDISRSSPHFRNSDVLVQELQKRLKVQKIKTIDWNCLGTPLDIIGILFAFLFLFLLYKLQNGWFLVLYQLIH